MPAEELARDFIREEVRRLVDRQGIGAVVSPDTGATIRGLLAERLGKAQPPRRPTFDVIVVVEQVEEIFAGEGEECVAVENTGLRLAERFSAEAVLVDLEDELPAAAEDAEWSGRIRAHGEIEVAVRRMASVHLNTSGSAEQPDARPRPEPADLRVDFRRSNG